MLSRSADFHFKKVVVDHKLQLFSLSPSPPNECFILILYGNNFTYFQRILCVYGSPKSCCLETYLAHIQTHAKCLWCSVYFLPKTPFLLPPHDPSHLKLVNKSTCCKPAWRFPVLTFYLKFTLSLNKTHSLVIRILMCTPCHYRRHILRRF